MTNMPAAQMLERLLRNCITPISRVRSSMQPAWLVLTA
jgi:hypothetical protein